MARQLDRGDPFPEFSVKTVAGATLNLPQQLTAEYAVLLFYRGHW